MNNSKNWYSRYLESKNKKQTYDYSWVGVKLPKELGDILKKISNEIEDRDLFNNEDNEYGREINPHITICYGIHTKDSDKIKKIFEGQKSGKVKMGKISHFECDDYDVVKIGVESSKLHYFNKIIINNTKCTISYPDYKPHATIAYVLKGNGEKYVEKLKNLLNGKTFVIEEVYFNPGNPKDQFSIKI